MRQLVALILSVLQTVRALLFTLRAQVLLSVRKGEDVEKLRNEVAKKMGCPVISTLKRFASLIWMRTWLHRTLRSS